MYQNVKHTCRTIVFAHLTYCFEALSLPSPSWLLKPGLHVRRKHKHEHKNKHKEPTCKPVRRKQQRLVLALVLMLASFRFTRTTQA